MKWLEGVKSGEAIFRSSENVEMHKSDFDRLIEIAERCEQGGLCWPTQFSSVPCCPVCGGIKELLGGHNYDTFRYSPVKHKTDCPYSDEWTP